MKNYLKFILTAFVLMAVVSCAKEEVADPNPENGVQENVTLVPMTITVVGDDSAKPGLKTDVADNLTSVVWCEDDEIAVFDKGGNKQRFEIVSHSGNTAVFEGQVEEGTTDFYAVYPYEAAESCNVSSREIVANALSSQTLSESGKVAPGALLTLAKGKRGESLVFKHALGLIRFDITRGDVSEIYLDGTALAGKATFSFDAEGNPEVKSVDEASETVALSGSFVEGGSYFIPVLPGTTETGNFHITIVTADGNGLVATHPGSVTVPRKGGFHLEDRNTNFTESFLIKDAATLKTFLADAKNYVAGQHATIIKDIDLTGETITSAASFKGILNGRNHSIKNWTSNGVSLIMILGDGGRIKNLNIDESCSLIPARTGNFGFLAQTSSKFSVVENCVNNADIDLNAETVNEFRIASLVGVSYGTMKNCINNGDITINVSGNATNKSYLGGLVGYANIDTQFKEKGEGYDVAFDGCTNNGDIVYIVNGTVNYLNMGGVAGGTSHNPIATAYFKGHAKGCTNTGKVSYTFKNGGSLEDNVGNAGSANYTNVGGVFGYWEGSLEKCTNRGDVSMVFPTSDASACASRPAVGGVCAFVMQKMTGCDNYGKVYMKGSSAGGGEANAGNGISAEVCAGGVVAQIGAKTLEDSFILSDCHNHGEVDIRAWMAAGNGTGFDLGGAVGYCGVPVENVTNNGKVTIESKGAYLRAGGVIGKAVCAASNLTNNGEVSFKGIRTSGTKQIGSELHFGGVVGSYSVSLTDSKNARNMTVTIESSDNGHAQALIGGVVGGKSSGILDKVYNEAAVTVNQNAVKSVVFGGVASWITGSVKITEAKNTGEISFNTDQMTGQLWCGGIAGYMDGDATMSGCTNDGPVSAVVRTSLTGQSFFGGVLGARADKNVTFNECVNKKTLTVKIPSSGTNGGFYYFGGVVGANKGHTYSNCANYGDIIYEGAAKIRIGGIASYTNKVATGVVRCNITAKCTGYDYSEIGGVISYTSGSEVTGAEFEGTIDTSGSTKKVYTGGIVGKTAGSGQKYNGCKFSGSLISADGNNVPGFYSGGLQNDKTTNVFGNTTKCVVGKGSSINGDVVTELTKENLVSQTSDSGTYVSYATLTNIVIE